MIWITRLYGRSTSSKNCPFGNLKTLKLFKWVPKCFVAGTPILMGDGTHKVIEQVKAGDLVISRDEATGATSVQKVVQTFERQAQATLVLRFSNGERIETTKEHPFYVESQGFTAAKELGIGTSIVTRAGPSAVLASTEVRNWLTTVYNFEVENTHTYFVGYSNLWVHNDCRALAEKIANNYHSFTKHIAPLKAIGITTRVQFADWIEKIMTTGVSKAYDRSRKTAYFLETDSANGKGWIVTVDPKNVFEGGSCFPTTRAYFDALT